MTPKHVDVPELLKITKFEGEQPDIQQGESVSDSETVYRTPAKDFELSRFRYSDANSQELNSGDGPEIILAIEGEITLIQSDDQITISPGQAAYIFPQTTFFVNSTLASTFFRARIPETSYI